VETTNSETDLFLSFSRWRNPTKPVQTLLKMKIWNVSIQRSTHNCASPRSP
jgi:type IV secretory pathway component VirB8